MTTRRERYTASLDQKKTTLLYEEIDIMRDMKEMTFEDLEVVAGGAPVSYGPPKYSNQHYMDAVKEIVDAVSGVEKTIKEKLLPQFKPVVAM